MQKTETVKLARALAAGTALSGALPPGKPFGMLRNASVLPG